MATETPTKKPVPPYIPYRTLVNLLAGWKVHLPSRIDRSVLGTFAGGTQSAIISALRYLGLIGNDNEPMPTLDALAKAEGPDRQKLLKQLLRTAYPFMFTQGFDLTKATPAQIDERFAETGASGETLGKCLSFFTAMAKDAGLALTPHLKTRQRRAKNGGSKVRKVVASDSVRIGEQVSAELVQQPKPIYQVLFELLDPEMDNDEQAAIWTLLRYVKKKGAQG